MYSLDVEARIRKRAQEIYDWRMSAGVYLVNDLGYIRSSTAEDDWLQAEREVMADVKSEQRDRTVYRSGKCVTCNEVTGQKLIKGRWVCLKCGSEQKEVEKWAQ